MSVLTGLFLLVTVSLASCASTPQVSSPASPAASPVEGATSTISAGEQSEPVAASAGNMSWTPGTLVPIEGYGDFSGIPYSDIDWYEVTRLEVACVVDQGFPVALIPPGDGVSFVDVPRDQNAAASAALEACAAGLALPDYVPATPEQIEAQYYFLIEVKACLEGAGYPTSEPPSLDAFVESWSSGPWHPYEIVAGDNQISVAEWNDLNVACPQQ